MVPVEGDGLKPIEELTPRRQRRRERNTLSLKKAARDVFERKGYVDTVVQDIIDEADVGRGTFYNYFDSKDVVFGELIDGLVDALVVAGTEIGDERSIRTRLQVSMRQMLSVAKKNRKLLGAVEQAIHVSHSHATRWAKLRFRLEEAIRRDLDWCKRHGFIAPTTATDVLSMILAGMVESTILEAPARPGTNLTEVEDVLVETYWNAVFRPHELAWDYIIEPGGLPKAIFE